MTDHIHDTSAAPEPESASVLTPPLREQLARAMWARNMRGAMPYEALPDAALDLGWRTLPPFARDLWHAYADEALAVVRAAMPERGTPARPLPWTEEFCAGWNAAIAEMEARLS